MRILELTLHEVRMKLVTPFETSMDRTNVRRFLLVQANVDGVIGWGECVAGETPYYSPETADTAWLILRDFLWPLIKGKDFACASDVWDLFGRVRAHNISLATVPNFIVRGDVSASKRYWEEDIIDPEVTVSSKGTIRVPSGPGIGFEPRLDRIDNLTVRKERLA